MNLTVCVRAYCSCPFKCFPGGGRAMITYGTRVTHTHLVDACVRLALLAWESRATQTSDVRVRVDRVPNA